MSDYITLEELKSVLRLHDVADFDQDLTDSILAAEAMIDDCCHRTFAVSEDANEVRYFTPNSRKRVWVDDLTQIVSVQTDTADDYTYATTLTVDEDYITLPKNADTISELRAHLTPWITREAYVKVTGTFGYPAVPSAIKEAARILAVKLFKRKREAPFGILTMGAEAGVLMRLTSSDPDVGPLISRYVRPLPPF